MIQIQELVCPGHYTTNTTTSATATTTKTLQLIIHYIQKKQTTKTDKNKTGVDRCKYLLNKYVFSLALNVDRE